MRDTGLRAAQRAAADADALAAAVLAGARATPTGQPVVDMRIAEMLRASAAELRAASNERSPAAARVVAIQGSLDAVKRFLDTRSTAHEDSLFQVFPIVQALRMDVSQLARSEIKSASGDTPAEISAAYSARSARDRSNARKWGSYAVGMSVAAVGVLLWGAIGVWLHPSHRSWFWVFVVVSAGALASAAPAWVAIMRSSRSARDNARVAIQVLQVRPYLDGIPVQQRAAASVMLAPRMFARILDDHDPMREPIWPSASQFLQTPKDD